MPTKVKGSEKDRSNDLQWNNLYLRLTQYKQKHGNCLVPDRYKDDRQLSFWVQEQRKRKNKGIMKLHQFKMLDNIGFTWQVRESWDDTFERLVAFQMKYGHCRVPRNFPEDMKLARWVNKQRSNYCKDDGMNFPEDRLAKLNSIGFVFRVKTATRWDEMFVRLNEYKEKHGHCAVPQDYQDDPQLGRWVNNRRVDYHKGNLSQDCISQLKKIEFTFGDTRENLWDEMYNRLVKYKEEHGDCLVPKNWKNDIKLSNWINLQRKKIETMSQERRTKLDDIGFIWETSHHSTPTNTTGNGCTASPQIKVAPQKSYRSSAQSWNDVKPCVTPDFTLDKLTGLPSSVGGNIFDHNFEGKKYFPIDDNNQDLDELIETTDLLGDEEDLPPPFAEKTLRNKLNMMERAALSKPSYDQQQYDWQHLQSLHLQSLSGNNESGRGNRPFSGGAAAEEYRQYRHIFFNQSRNQNVYHSHHPGNGTYPYGTWNKKL